MGNQRSSWSHRTTRLRNKQTHLAVTYLREGGSWRLESLITRYYRFPWTFRRNSKNLGSLAVICSGSQFPSFSTWSHSSQLRWTFGFSWLTKDIKQTKYISNAKKLKTIYKCCSNTHINWSHLSTEIITDCNSTIPHGHASDELWVLSYKYFTTTLIRPFSSRYQKFTSIKNRILFKFSKWVDITV